MEEPSANLTAPSNSSLRPELTWQDISLVSLLCVVITVTVIGNTLIIVAVVTTRRLRTVTNCFVMSLAVADWLVGIFVMPPKVALQLMGSWQLGSVACDIWISLDVLLCTASILSLCAISVDRYLAVTQPLNYSRKRRSKRLALLMILAVWLAAIAITCPPIFGWYESGRHEGNACRYNENRGYVVFSAMGSFFLPLTVMLYVYVRIWWVVARRHNQLTELDGVTQRTSHFISAGADESDVDRPCSECEESGNVVGTRCTSVASTEVLQFSAQHHQRTLRAHYTYCPPSCGSTPTVRASYYGRPRSEIVGDPPNSRVSSLRRESKTTQTLYIVVGGFVFCWLPFFVIYLLTPFFPANTIPSLVMSFLVWLGWINSAINPFIYAFYSPDFRIAFWRLTFRHCSKPRRPADPSFRHK